MSAYCEDYPCCGHTPDDPCQRQWYDEPGAFDTSIPGNEHALCEHEAGICDVPEEDPCDDEEHECNDCDNQSGEWECSWCRRVCPDGAHDDVLDLDHSGARDVGF